MKSKQLKEPNYSEALILNARATLAGANDDAIFTPSLAALYCGISEYTLMQETKATRIIGTKHAKFWYFRKKFLDDWILNRK
jgi:uncharacterized RDD family membrane protein YckC